MFAPLLYLTVGFWMFDNIQIFHNDVMFQRDYNEHIRTGHSIISVFTHEIDHSFPMLIMLVLILLGTLTRGVWIRKINRYIGYDKVQQGFKTEEVSFFEALSKRQRKCLLR